MLKKYDNLLNINRTICKELFISVAHPWEVLPKINSFILNNINKLDNNYYELSNNVWVHKTAKISDKATIIGPTIIGENTEIRPNAYIRGNAIIGKNCVIGNSTEVKNSIIFDNVQCPHFNYVGDSIMGEYSHIGAGVILSNVKSDKSNVLVKYDNGDVIKTNLKKFSSIIGDRVEVGCNSVLNPGTIIGENSVIYPLTMVRGVIESNTIVKDKNTKIKKIKIENI